MADPRTTNATQRNTSINSLPPAQIFEAALLFVLRVTYSQIKKAH
jgi:hypothetical protein